MKKIYFTITGTKYRYGHDFLKPGMKVHLEKEPDNEYDAEMGLSEEELVNLKDGTMTSINS